MSIAVTDLVNIYNQVVKVLRDNSAVQALGLTSNDIYTVPTIGWFPGCAEPITIQVADGTTTTLDADGSVLRENFGITIGLLITRRMDDPDKYHDMLSDTAKSIWLWQMFLKSLFHGNFLLDDTGTFYYLTRPMTLRSVSGNRAVEQNPSTLVKALYFDAGINSNLPLVALGLPEEIP